jgi:hypothetical protein
MRLLQFTLVSLVASSGLAFAGKVQKSNLVLPASARGHRDAVEKIFVTSYEAYKSVLQY